MDCTRKKVIKAKALTLLIFLLLTRSFASAQQAAFSKSSDSLFQKECELNTFSGTVMLVKKDSIILRKSCGYSNMDKGILNDTSTKFNIASVGKLFTQVVILQLIQEGKISLTDTIGKFFPGFNQPHANQITVFYLLNHSSGLGDVYVSNGYLNLHDYTLQDSVVKIIANEKLLFDPGAKTKYSNSGYYLLGAIASKVENKKFESVVKDRIFKPLDMVNSGFAKTGDIVPDHALPYEMKNNKISQINVKLIGDPPSGAGSEYCTANDLCKFYLSIVNDNKLLNNSSKALLFNHYNPGDWNSILRSGKIIGFVGGDTRGWSSKITFMFLGDTPYGVIILANFDNMAHELDLKIRPVVKAYALH